QHLQALGRADAHVVAAVLTDREVGLELAVMDHLAAGRAFGPEVLRHILLLADQRADARADEVGEPVHARAPRTALASCSTVDKTPATGSFALITWSTSTVPTTAPSATRAIAAACSGVRMPKPTATGRSVCRFTLATAPRTSASSAALVPV